MNMGYACINMQLSYPQKWGGKEKGVKPITTGRSMIKRTFESKGVDYASEVALKNCMDLDKIIESGNLATKVSNGRASFFTGQYTIQ